jgi:hypothetical protein
MKLIKADNAPGIARDPTNQALLSTDFSALEAYKAKRRRDSEINAALGDINMLKDEISTIKGLLLQLIDKKDG